MAGVERHLFRFDAFRLEVEERRLVRNQDVVTLSPRAFDILLTLIQNAGTTVEKDALIDAVWKDTFVEEGNLNRHVSTLRRVLGDDPRKQRYIKTIPKRGYRFTARVTETVESEESISIASTKSRRLVIKEETIESFWTDRKFTVAGLLMLAVAILAAWVISDRRTDDRSSVSPESRATYERARQLWRDRTATGLHEATLLLENVVRGEPEFALAHAALADAYAFDYGNWKKAEASARTAISLDPAIGEPHASIGFVRMFWEWNLPEAEVEFKQTVQLSPQYATGRQWFALNLAATGHGDGALAEITKALELEPNSAAIHTDRCQLLYFASKFSEAKAQCEMVLDLWPESAPARELLFHISMTTGDFSEAVNYFRRNLADLASDTARIAGNRALLAYEREGISGFRIALIEFYRDTIKSHYKTARVLAESGETEAAIDELVRAAEAREFDYIFVVPDPAFRKVNLHPRRFVLPYPHL